MSLRRLCQLCALVWMGLACATVRAHTPSETFLTFFVQPSGVTGQWDVAERDLIQGIGLDDEKARAVRPDELDRRLQGLALDVVSQIDVRAGGQKLTLRATDYLTIRLRDLDYVRVQFASGTNLATSPSLAVDASALFRVDTNMQGVIRVEHGGRTEAASFNRSHPAQTFTLSAPASRAAQAWTFLRDGADHIWKGPDHILFLVALLLPAVLRRDGASWTAAEGFRAAGMNIVKIVTAFTIAHSITLSLAVLGIINISGRIVEPVIALSVIAAAANNLRPWFGERGWIVAFAFGLVHGLGLAGFLVDAGLTRETLALGLVSYNLGVEVGQLSIVAVFLPLAWGLRHTWAYQTAVFRVGSALVILVSAVWMAERMFDFKALPF